MVVALALLPLTSASAAVVAPTCSEPERQLGLCSSVGEGAVELEAWQDSPGSQPLGQGERPPWLYTSDTFRCFVTLGREACLLDATPAVTIRDIASFVPSPGQQRMQPDGWTVAGLPTNFYALTSQHVVAGTLLGRPADVRFTPIAFHWTYGDGTSATRPTRGATWAAQGLGEFEPTPTSHVYEQLGAYTITLDITFRAEYRFDGSAWRPVVGTITLPANDLHIRVGTAKTVLVEQDCVENPGGPGC